MRDYCGLHNHSQYSNIKIIDSTNRFNRMVDYAWDLGLSGLAMTEHDCLSGAVEAMDVWRAKLKKEWEKAYPGTEMPGYAEAAEKLDFTVILGNEIYLSEEGTSEEKMKSVECHFWHLILLAKDLEGFVQLKHLSSAAWGRAWMRGILRTPTYPSDLINVIQGGHVICSTACLGGYAAWAWKQYCISKANVESGDNWMNEHDAEYYIDKLDNHLAAMEQLFGKGNFYIELQPNEPNSEQNEYNQFMINRYWGQYPFIFTTDAHYLKADEREIHAAFLNSKSSKDRETNLFYKYTYIMAQSEIRSLMPYVDDAQFNEMVANTRKIRNMCQFYELEHKPILAKVAYEHYDEYAEDLKLFDDVREQVHPNFYHYVHSQNKTDSYLARLVAHGYKEHCKPSWNKTAYYNRLEEEFWTLKEVGDKIQQPMADYFITMSKIIELVWDKANSIVGPSRGSAGALLINYLLGITQMNPLVMNLPFVWRFLHPSRPDLPDQH